MTAIFADFLSDELTVIRMAELLDEPGSECLSQRQRLMLYRLRLGIGFDVGSALDYRAVRNANMRRTMDERELVGEQV